MIPNFTISGFLPPFRTEDSPANPQVVSPYRVSMLQLAHKLAFNEERKNILKGLVAYRTAIRSIGVTSGFQWIDGSFVEDCEKHRGRPPKDIDIITFAFRPQVYNEIDKWREFFASRRDLFDPEQSKKEFSCDAYFVDLAIHPVYLVNQTKYWFSLFSHQRETLLWKGMLEVSLDEDDSDVTTFLTEGGSYGA